MRDSHRGGQRRNKNNTPPRLQLKYLLNYYKTPICNLHDVVICSYEDTANGVVLCDGREISTTTLSKIRRSDRFKKYPSANRVVVDGRVLHVLHVQQQIIGTIKFLNV